MEPQKTHRAKKRAKFNIYLLLGAILVLGAIITATYSAMTVKSHPEGVLAPGDTATQPAK